MTVRLGQRAWLRWSRAASLASADWRPAALAGVGMLLVFSAPGHRVDLLVIGLALTLGGIIWSPPVGPLLIGASLPVFFFSRTIIGPFSVTPPGLALIASWLAVATRRKELALRWPRTGYDAPLAVFLIAAVLSLLVTQYPLLSVREMRALILEPVLFFWLLYVLPGSTVWAVYGFLGGATFTALAAVVQGPLGIGGTQTEGVLRAQAWYPSANHLALMLGRAWPLLIAGALQCRKWLWVPAACVG